MPDREPTLSDARDDPATERDFGAEIQSLEEALTLAAAAPGRRRLERLEELLLLRAVESRN